MYFLQLMDNYVGGWTLLMIGFAENIAIAYCYGKETIYNSKIAKGSLLQCHVSTSLPNVFSNSWYINIEK